MAFTCPHEGNRYPQVRVRFLVSMGDETNGAHAAEVSLAQAYESVADDQARGLSPSSGPERTDSWIAIGILWWGHEDGDPRESATRNLVYVQREGPKPERHENNQQRCIKRL